MSDTLYVWHMYVCMICTRSKLEGGNDVVVVLQFVDLRGEGVGRGEHLDWPLAQHVRH